MKTKLILLLLLSSLANWSYSQNITAELSATLPEKGDYTIIGQSKESIVCIRVKKKSRFLETFSVENYSPQLSQKIVFKTANKEKLDYEYGFVNEGEVVLLASDYNKSEDKKILFASVFNLDGTLKSTWTRIADFKASNNKNSGKFGFEWSEDKQKFLVYSVLSTKKTDPSKVVTFVFDRNLSLISEETIDVKADEQAADLDEFQVSNTGHIFFLAHKPNKFIYDRAKIIKASEDISNHMLVCYDIVTKQLDQHSISLENKTVLGAKLNVDKNNSVYVAGMYQDNSGSLKGLSGFFHTKLDAGSKTLQSFQFAECDKNFLNQLIVYAQGKNISDIRNSFELLDMYIGLDGELILTAFEYWTHESCSSTKDGGTTCTIIGHYDKIFAVALKPEGGMAWFNFINRDATDRNSMLMCFSSSFMKDGKLYILLNQNFEQHEQQNLKKSIKELDKKTRNATVALAVVIDAQGKMTFNSLFNSAERKIYMAASDGVSIYDASWLSMSFDFKGRAGFIRLIHQ